MKKSILLLCAALGTLVFLPTKSDADWQRSNGPWSGQVMDILADGSNVFAGSRGGGVFLSTDNGSTWMPLDNGLTNPYVNSLAVSGSNLFAGTTTLYG
ncbi:MAG: regulator, partial [Verrucomicrobia bacterium]|nr:regulator [Verrucomicrobiota bacterium]